MASAEQKAIALKDAYVKGIADATADSFSALPEKDMGDTAGRVIDLKHKADFMVNDGNPTMVIRDGNNMTAFPSPAAAYPLGGQGFGAKGFYGIQNDLNKQQNAASVLYSGPSVRDGIMADQYSTNNTDLAENVYRSAMTYPILKGVTY